jgi:hypothetical protein
VPTSHANPSNDDNTASTPYLRLNAPGDHPVDVPVTCVITRFGLRSPLSFLLTYIDYRRTIKQAAQTPGLLRSAFLVENLTTCYSLSIWSCPDAIPLFGTNVPYHVTAARSVFGRLLTSKHGSPELWSTKWRLTVVSNNLQWEDFDLRSLILSMVH